MSVNSVANQLQSWGDALLNKALDKTQQINQITNDAVATNTRINLQRAQDTPIVDLFSNIGLEKGIGIDIKA
jgi:hypothetical protein